MNLTYEVNDNGYTIFNNGVAWIAQDVFIPYPKETLAQSAQAHIDAIIAENEANEQAATDFEQLKRENKEIKLALAELKELQSEKIADIELALADIFTNMLSLP